MKAHAPRVIYTGNVVDWHTVVQKELREVEQCLAEMIKSDVPAVHELSRHLLQAGGKRLRPALVFLSAHAAGGVYDKPPLVRIATTVELIHMASLVHDDVIDNSESRRGRTTANSFWGNKISVLSGDCMISKAFQLLAQDGDQRIQRVISETTIKMSESEVLQALCDRDFEGWQKNYWHIIKHKTAGFLSACCCCGAIIANAPATIQESLAQFGMDIGMAFQLTDDILDIAGDPSVTGKPMGNDLREGKVTLPVLLAIAAMSETEQERARAIIEDKTAPLAEVDALCKKIASSNAIEMAREHALDFAERAVLHLDKLPSSEVKSAMASLASQIVHRIN